MKKIVITIRDGMGLDFHVLSTVLLRGWTIGAGFITTILLPALLSPAELGYYFSFASILALQIFFELGFNQVITQIAGHEAAELTIDNNGALDGDTMSLARLSMLSSITRRWYLFSAIAFAMIVVPAGLLFFGRSNALASDKWAAPWLVLVAATAINLYLSPRLSILEGCGRIGNIARLRLRQSLLGYGCAWITLFAGGGLWSATCVPLASCFVTTIWLYHYRYFSRRFLRLVDSAHTMSWRHDILPLQWKISLSWISGYFIYSLFTPLIFSTAGPVAAGRFGLSMAIFTGLSTVGMSWMYAKVPEFSRFASRRDIDTLDRIFRSAAARAVGITVVLCVLFVVFTQIFAALRPNIAKRILSVTDLSLLAVAVIANSAVSAAAVYMRSFREEPMLPISIVTAVLTCGAVWIGSRVSVTAMLGLYTAVITGVMLPWTFLVFRRYSYRLRISSRANGAVR